MTDDIVTVQLDLPGLGLPEYVAPIAILLNRSIEEIEAFTAEHPTCFVLPFYTGSPYDAPNFAVFNNNDHVTMPWYVGNLEPVNEAIDLLVDKILAYLSGPWKIIRDDR